MSQNNFGEELPCGGYVEEDKLIQKNMKTLSLQTSNDELISKKSCQQNQCCQQSCKDIKKQKNTQKKQCCACPNDCLKCQCLKNYQFEKKNQEKTIDRTKLKPMCKKCKNEPAVLVHKNESICKTCILKNVEYKCRLTLQNSMKVQEKSKMLICFSGGLNSICLVYILSNIKKRYQKHHLFGELRCIHIQQQQKIPEKYKQTFEAQTGIPLQIVNIEEIFEDKNKSLNDVKEIFSMFNKAANSIDLLELFRDKLILDYAKANNFDFILKGLNGESIASSVFKYFTKGVGGNVTQLSGTEKDCIYHFPLRQHLQKELQYYFYTHKCSKISLLSEEDDISNFCSDNLDNNLNEFILNLQTLYTHTAPAITRTAQKIESNRKNQIRCKWCKLKGTIQPHGLCRKCDRIYECRNSNFNQMRIPKWLKVAQ